MSRIDKLILHPKDTAEILAHYNSECQHLWYAVHYNQQASEDDKQKELSRNKKDKQEVEYMFRKSVQEIKMADSIKVVIKKLCERRLCLLQKLEPARIIQVLNLIPDTLIVHGLGSSHVRENGITIHPIYGVPYIPGSSIKGVMRHWFIDAMLEGKQDNIKNNSLEASIGQALFGTEELEGAIQFYDVYLYDGLTLRPDVLTPHFSDYYGAKKEPTDRLFPVPNVFYGVKINSAQLVFVTDSTKLQQLADHVKFSVEQMKQLLIKWVSAAMQEVGIGGKSSSGYGLFSHSEDVTEKVMPYYRNKLKEQQEQLQLARLHKLEQRRLIKMSPLDKLVYEIDKLTVKELDESKNELYNRVLSEGSKEAAIKLRDYWKSHEKGKASKKQQDKYKELEKLIGE
ncbi:type III-B CRISPR module RAMP protein Cmr6 [Paenibacillus sp. SYP-B4298]|uniref:type III-B CRISPR module RAMP protein Cmr6 n=1 Tax=Paenibacillus sp. SYP-B4298 TaxID=2996034 RepID=UPI0022DE25D6|nr:type III-B CRISPR module RAMP protein Cmr6 [Paenibacillus sp. SYP-B4298]